MDTSRKTLTDRETCCFCVHYQQIINQTGTKTCNGKCKITGNIKARTNKICKKNFRSRDQISLF